MNKPKEKLNLMLTEMFLFSVYWMRPNSSSWTLYKISRKSNQANVKIFHTMIPIFLDQWTNGWTNGVKTNNIALSGAPPLPWLKITWLKVRVAWSKDRVSILWTPSVHVLVMSQDVISSISKWTHTSQSVQWVISCGYFFFFFQWFV